MKKIDLPLKQLGIQCHINPARIDLNDQPNLDNIYGLVRTLSAHFPVEKQDPIVFEYGDDWWEMLKQRWFPKWALKRWPVKMCKKTWTVETIYPSLKTQMPPTLMGPMVTILVNDRPVGSFLTDPMGMTPAAWNDHVAKHDMNHGIRKCRGCGRDLELMFKL